MRGLDGSESRTRNAQRQTQRTSCLILNTKRKKTILLKLRRLFRMLERARLAHLLHTVSYRLSIAVFAANAWRRRRVRSPCVASLLREAQGELNRRCEFSRWALRRFLSSARYAAASAFDGTDGDACMEMQPVRISQQLFDADLRDPASKQVAHRRLVLIQNVRELRLGVALQLYMFQDGGQEFSLDLECARFRRRKSQRIEDIALHNMCRPIFRCVFHDSSAPLIAV